MLWLHGLLEHTSSSDLNLVLTVSVIRNSLKHAVRK